MAKKAFVTGFPIKHSRSPLIHGFWLKELGLEGSYEAIEVAPENFVEFATSLEQSGFVGGNVTIPHKEVAFATVGSRDEAAEAIGAVNTLWLENGKLCGGNTDAYGFAANLDALAPDWDNADTALVLGAGGAGRAIVHALQKRGFSRISIVNRTLSRAEELASHFGKGVSAHGWDAAQRLVKEAGLIVNTTSLGMSGHGEAEEFPLDLSEAQKSAVATDIVYIPLKTPFLAKAEAAGLKTVDGLGMLLHQAVPGFERWFGKRPQVTEALRNYILDDMKKAGAL
ncbi:shikimate dehydrogenase [Ochrobactrum sp. MYb15]|uniref:shikimate dehydrogenase n=1 Tax=Brucella pituitosa TaxID=571256 RepID=UPI000CFB7BEE|nr:shikimate dehydrogenase [Ochrobactrum sp. MYb19]PRA57879.1 shikimate dehydrogenase [Ochrobactrum sp. MYb68]PRA67266.1 shikimate dehydrogenase [Ochrobactrum sp. MYb18]PRA77775.1 shikimate dehydrogenase [Brucella thiophenivorans]PRA92276.1 shikimate dehydrogenase [Ochrobactrum sp. MYb14]PRA99785.1 shikimate dehydrogenase [Ochrobactrum sp. MYb15]